MNIKNKEIYRVYMKRTLDFSMALISIILLLWPLVLIAILVKMKLGSPVIFKQSRPGLDGKIFKMYKFRTMTNDRDSEGRLLSDEQRLTKFGSFLRSTSLDELPELINVLKGDMSLVGPRPLLVEYLALYSDFQKQRHKVRPGLTGLAQINGRNSISWDYKFKLDVSYVNSISFKGDMKILAYTFKKIIIREGINSENAATMEVFRGNDLKNDTNLK